ncbi:MAG: alpha/beta hydrolase [Planctomycetaceae bacterium]|nr:alpha/beta hydrolase [Planctomycetaceae bacterium]
MIKLFILCSLAATLCLTVPLFAADADAAAVRDRVWSRYLNADEKAVLTRMTPPSGNEDPLAGLPDEEKVTTLREFVVQFIADVSPPLAMPTEAVSRDGVRGVWFNPETAARDKVVLYFHGGGFIYGDAMTARGIVGNLAERAGIRGFSLDYPLAPESRYPAAHDNAVSAYEMLLRDGFKPENIVLAGDSAGGNLVLGTLLRLRDRQLPMPAGALLLSPWIRLGGDRESARVKREVDPGVTVEAVTFMASMYAPDHDWTDPLFSPYYADLTGLPPLLVHVGSHEILLDDAVAVARNAAMADVPVTLKVWPGYGHVFQYPHSVSAGGRKSLEDGARFFTEVLSGTHLLAK